MADENKTMENSIITACSTWSSMMLENREQTMIGLDKRHPVQLVCATDDKIECKLQLTPVDPSSSEESDEPFLGLHLTKCKYKSKTVSVSCALAVRDTSGELLFSKSIEGEIMKEGDVHVLCTKTEAKDIFVDDLQMMFVSCDVDTKEIEGTNGQREDMEEASQINHGAHSKILDDYEKLFDEHEFGDVVLCVGSEQIIAYRGILSARSPYFREMFTKTHRDKRKVDIEGIEFEVLQEVIRYIYADRLPKISTLAKELFKAAHKFELKELKKICSKEISSKLTVDSVADDLLLALTYHDEDLRENAIELIRNNRKQVFATPRWKAVFRKHTQVMAEVLLELMNG